MKIKYIFTAFILTFSIKTFSLRGRVASGMIGYSIGKNSATQSYSSKPINKEIENIRKEKSKLSKKLDSNKISIQEHDQQQKNYEVQIANLQSKL